ncbi:MAG: RCC1 domain-containing protein, partial [Roseiflexaceae bacterium]
GGSHSLALKANGTVVAWGLNSSGQSNVPSGLSNVVAIAAGGSHSLALKSDGTVVAWGYNGSGQSSVPSGLSNVVAIAAGGSHSLALKSDGTVVGWGLNSTGQSNQQFIGQASVNNPGPTTFTATPSTTTLSNTATSQATVLLTGMNASEFFTVTYRNGGVFYRGRSNESGAGRFAFFQLVAGRYTIDITTASGKQTSLTFNVTPVGVPPTAQPCTITQVKPSTPFTSGLIYGSPTTQTYDLTLTPGNAQVITTTMLVNSTHIANTVSTTPIGSPGSLDGNTKTR